MTTPVTGRTDERPMTSPVAARPAPAEQFPAIPFGRLVRAEWRKATGTRAARWLLAAVALTTIGGLEIPLLFPRDVTQTRASYLAWAGLGLTRLLPIVLQATGNWVNTSQTYGWVLYGQWAGHGAQIRSPLPRCCGLSCHWQPGSRARGAARCGEEHARILAANSPARLGCCPPNPICHVWHERETRKADPPNANDLEVQYGHCP